MISVYLMGYNQLGKRVADALRRQPDLRLAGVFDGDAGRQQMIRTLGLPLLDGETLTRRAADEVMVVCECGDRFPPPPVPTVYGPDARVTSSLYGLARQPDADGGWRVPCADALAFARLLEALPPVERLFSSCARRTGPATDHRFARVDALEPLFELPEEDADLRALLAVDSVHVRRTRVPYTHSHVHHLKLDVQSPFSREAALAALRVAPRVRVAAGFANTGQLQEYDRDLGRPRGDRPEVFVWEETVAVIGRSLFLTIDVSPDATPVPEMIDAVRQLARPELTLDELRQMTDRSLASKG